MSRRRIARPTESFSRRRPRNYRRPQVEMLESRSLLAMVDFLDVANDEWVFPEVAERPELVDPGAGLRVRGREEPDLAYLARRVPPHELPLLDKVNTQLLTLFSRHLQGQSSDVTRQVINDVPLDRLWVHRNGMPQIRAYVSDVSVAQQEFAALGLELSGTLDSGNWRIIEGYLPVSSLGDSAAVTGLTYLDVAIQPRVAAAGVAANQWEEESNADQLKRLLGASGSSIDIGVISDSINRVGNGLADSQSTGDLPPGDRVRILQDGPLSGADEGRAMTELMYDIGPGFDFIFHTGFTSVSDFAAGIGELAAAGADIIVDDVFWSGQPQFQQGPLEQAVNEVVASGVPYFAHAGNHNRGSRYGVWSDVDGDNYHEFSTSPFDEALAFSLDGTIPGTVTNNSLFVELHWDEWWGSAATDFNLEVWDATNTVLQAASNQGNVGSISMDTFFFQNPASVAQNFNLRIRYIGGAAPTDRQLLIASYPNGATLFTDAATLGQPSIYGHSGAELAFSIAAVPAGGAGLAEGFSSRGPKRLAFNNSGIRLEPTRVLAKPDFAAADQVATSVPGFLSFSGTSAAAPNAAAIAGLLLDAAGGPGSLTRDDLYSILSSTTGNTEDSLWNSATGWGVIDALGAGVAVKGPEMEAIAIEFNQFGMSQLTQEINGNSDIDRFTVAAVNNGLTTIQAHGSLVYGKSVDLAMAYWDMGSPPEFAGVSYSHVINTGWALDEDPKITIPSTRGRIYQFAVFSEEDRTGTSAISYAISARGPAPVVTPVATNSSGQAVISGTLADNLDVAYYELIAPAAAEGRLVISSNFSQGGLDAVLTLFSESGVLLAREDANGRGVGEVLTYDQVQSGAKYVVRVGSRNYASSGTFQLAADFGQPLSIEGTAGRDDIVLDYVDALHLLNVSVNGVSQLIPWSSTSTVQYSSIIVDGRGDSDSIRILRDPPTGVIIVRGGEGDDSIVLGQNASRFHDLSTNNIVLEGGDGRDTVLVVDNASNDDPRPYIVSHSVFTREGDQTVVALGEVEQINVASNSLSTEFRVGDVPVGSAIAITDAGGADTLVFGDESGQSLNGYQGGFDYRGALDSNLRTSVVWHDEQSGFTGDYRISSSAATSTLLRGTARWVLRNVSDLTLRASEAESSFLVNSTQFGTNWTIDAGGGADTLQVTPGSGLITPFPVLVGGNVNALQGDVEYQGGGGADEVVVDDRYSGVGRQFTLDGAQVNWGGVAGVAFDQVRKISLLAGNASDKFTVGGGDLIQQRVPELMIDGGGGRDEVAIRDEMSTVAGSYVLGTQVVSESLVEGEFRKFYRISPDLQLATSRVATRAIETLGVLGSGSSDEFTVNSTPVGQDLILHGGELLDVFTVLTGQLHSRVDITHNADAGLFAPDRGDLVSVKLIGDGDDVGVYSPGIDDGRGSIVVNGQIISFTGLWSVYASHFAEFTLVTPRSQDVVTVNHSTDFIFSEVPSRGWTSIRGASGVGQTEFTDLRAADIGTLVLNVATNDLTPDSPLTPLINPSDTVSLQAGAFDNTDIGTFRVITGLGNDVVDDNLTQSSESSTTLDIAASVPGAQHRLHGTPDSVKLYQTGPNTSRYEAFDSQGRLLHRATQSLVSRVTLPDSQQNVQFLTTDSNVRVDLAGEGLQQIDVGGLTSWQFLPHATSGRLAVQAAGDSTIMIIAILTPLPLDLWGSSTTDKLTVITDLSSPDIPESIHVQAFDSGDELLLRTLAQEGLADRIAIDLRDSTLLNSTFQQVPDSPSEDAAYVPSLNIQVDLPEEGEGPRIDVRGSGAAHDALQVFAPRVAPDSDRAPRRINAAAIELLTLFGPHLALEPNAAGGVSARAGFESLSESASVSVVVDADSQLDHASLDTRLDPSLPSDLGDVLIEHGESDAPMLAITPYAIELLVMPQVTDFAETLTHTIRREIEPLSLRSLTRERVEVGSWTVDRALADDQSLNTTLMGTRVDTRILGDYPAEQSLILTHRLTGSESTLTIEDTRLGGSLALNVIGAENADNRVAFAAVNTQFDGNLAIGFTGPTNGNNAVVVGAIGSVFGENSQRTVSVAAGGGETVVFQADSNNLANQPWTSEIQLTGGSTTILTARAADLSTNELYEQISVHAQACSLGIEETLQLLPEPYSRSEQTPTTNGDSPQHQLSIQGVGDVTLVAYDGTTGGTDVRVEHEGGLTAITDGNVTVGLAHLEGIENIPEGPLFLCTVTNTNDGGVGSLRHALACADNSPSSSIVVIGFAIPESDPGFIDIDSHLPNGDEQPDVFVIQLESALPANYRGGVVINGQSQASWTGDTNTWGPEIVLDGILAGESTHGWELRSSDNRLHGVNIQQFGGHGVFVAGKANVITGSYLGTDATGRIARGNGQSGVWIETSFGNVIGGVTEDARNVISGNGTGITISGGGADENQILGNYVGTDASGTAALGNTGDGVLLVNGASWNRIANNVISGNAVFGVSLQDAGTSHNTIQANYIGTDKEGAAKLPNVDGVSVLLYATGNLIGGTTAEERNIISGNNRFGVVLASSFSDPDLRNYVQGNFIGTDSTGQTAVGNLTAGVALVSDHSGVIGGAEPGAGNVISGNGPYGIWLYGGNGNRGVRIQGNIIGGNADQTAILPNWRGIEVNAAGANSVENVLIGGTNAGEGNVISGNSLVGIQVIGAATTGLVIAGNAIGTDRAGTVALPNEEEGILLDQAQRVTVGGTLAAARNIISANRGNGITVLGGLGHVIQGNAIGTDRTGQIVMGNQGDGIRVAQGASGVFLGADGDGAGDAAEGNIIAFNGRDGVSVVDNNSLMNAIRRNAIFGNAYLGIDLADDGATLNDTGNPTSTPPLPPDLDVGPNSKQNYPEISSARRTTSGANAGLNVSGVLKSSIQSVFVIDLYLADDVTGSGRRWLASVERATNGEGNVSFSFSLPLNEAVAGQFVTTTATQVISRADGRILGATSEFSPARQITGQNTGGGGGNGNGNGNGNGGGRPLTAAAIAAAPASSQLEPRQLEPIMREALARWQAAGVASPSSDQITVGIQDLPGRQLGWASGNALWIDANGAGWGWFIDATPADDREFSRPGDQGEQHRMDLLSVVMHELGHLLGYEHEKEGVMEESLLPGVRRADPRAQDAAVAELICEHAHAYRNQDGLGAWLNRRY